MAVDYLAKTAVVTGAGSGIGRALSIELARRGANVAASDIDQAGLEETIRLCGPVAGQVEPYVVDMSDRAAVWAHADEVAGTFSAVHLVVNNAGVAVVGTIEETAFEDIDWLLGVNLYGVIHGTKAFLPHLIASGDGHLVNISSVFGLVAPAFSGVYATSKFAVAGFTEALRQEMIIGGHPVSVHAVHPGGIKTDIVRHARLGPSTRDSGRDPAREFVRLARTSAKKAARRILAGVDAGRPRILVGPDAYLIAALPRLFGARYSGLLTWAGRQIGRR
ncbi:MAG: SDR family oxidoreductase [Acidimicrobiales bacterium]|nr:SDR family oxidoreductase [Acidimicrobiales bacterium]